MLNSVLLALIALCVPGIMMLAIFFLSARKNIDREKASPFECGFDPKSSARIPFSIRFFLLAVIFLVFDIEVVLLIPLPISVIININISVLRAFLFLGILIVGLLHE